MKIYNYSKKTREFIKESDAKKDPLEQPEKFLIPAYATDKQPLETKENEVCIFNQSKEWEIKADYKGLVYFTEDGERQEINEIGVVPPDGYLIERPFMLEEEKQKRIKTRKHYLSETSYMYSHDWNLASQTIIDKRNQALQEINEIENATTEEELNNI